MPRKRMTRIIGLAVALLLAIMAGTAVLPVLVRALPGRYAYYLPEPLLAFRHVEHPATLPTPQVAPASTATDAPPGTPMMVVRTFTPVPTATATPRLTETPSPTATPTATPTPVPTLPFSVTLSGVRHEPQGWNNCGPTTLAMQLSYWGCEDTQAQLAPALKPDPEDKNVSPEEMAAHAQARGFETVLRVGGDLAQLKRLLDAGFPVIVETWDVIAPTDQLGHYRLIVGYDEAAQAFLTYDSLHGPDLWVSYQEIDELWRVFNRVYLVAATSETIETLLETLGPAADAAWSREHALAVARAEAADPPKACVAYAACADAEAFAWFNVGSSLTALSRYPEAAAAFDQARVLGLPWRMLWYQFGPYEAYHAVGRYDDVINLATQLLQATPNLEESYYWRGRARLAKEDIAGARADFEAALRYHPEWPPAQEALNAMEEEH